MEISVENARGFQFLVGRPDGFCKDKSYPCIIFLHGAGSRGSNIEPLLNNTISQYCREHETDFLLIEPQCSADTWFDVYEHLMDFTMWVRELPYVDKARLALTGNSLGGYACWQLAMSHPELFCAIAPVCGGGMYWNANRLKYVSVWAFHGENDTVVFPEESIKMVKAVNAVGGNARLTLYPDRGHDSWVPTYQNPELYCFLTKARAVCEEEKSDLYLGENYG